MSVDLSPKLCDLHQKRSRVESDKNTFLKLRPRISCVFQDKASFYFLRDALNHLRSGSDEMTDNKLCHQGNKFEPSTSSNSHGDAVFECSSSSDVCVRVCVCVP